MDQSALLPGREVELLRLAIDELTIDPYRGEMVKVAMPFFPDVKVASWRHLQDLPRHHHPPRHPIHERWHALS